MSAKIIASSGTDLDCEFEDEEPNPIKRLLATGRRDQGRCTYTVDEALEVIGYGRVQWLAILYASFVWFHIGAVGSAWLPLVTALSRCEFNDKSSHLILNTVASYSGYLGSSFLVGVMSDKFGRKPTISSSMIFGYYFFLLQSLAPTVVWLALLLFLTSFFVTNALGQSVVYCAELVPSKHRKVITSALQYAFCSGGLVIYALTMILFEFGYGWRVSCPLFCLFGLLFLVVSYNCPETPHFLVSVGRVQQAERLLVDMAGKTGSILPSGRLVQSAAVCSELKRLNGNNWSLLFTPAKTLFVLVCSVSARVMVSSLYQGYYFFTNTLSTTLNHEKGKCPPFSTGDYVNMMWSLSAEIFGSVFLCLAVKVLPQRMMLFLLGIGMTIPVLLLLLPSLNASKSIALVFVSRIFSSALSQASFIFHPEFFASVVRGKATGIASGFGTVGSVLGVYIFGSLVSEETPGCLLMRITALPYGLLIGNIRGSLVSWEVACHPSINTHHGVHVCPSGCVWKAFRGHLVTTANINGCEYQLQLFLELTP